MDRNVYIIVIIIIFFNPRKNGKIIIINILLLLFLSPASTKPQAKNLTITVWYGSHSIHA